MSKTKSTRKVAVGTTKKSSETSMAKEVTARPLPCVHLPAADLEVLFDLIDPHDFEHETGRNQGVEQHGS
jgi:hypothetical protein